MAVGFVLINTESAKTQDVYQELLMIKEIVELTPLFGEYDFHAKVVADDFDLLGKVVVDKIRVIPGITGTKTLTGINL